MSESIIIMTTNLGAELFSAGRVGFGEADTGARSAEIVNKIEAFLSPELVNRVDDIVLFKPFTQEDFVKLAGAALNEIQKRINGMGNCSLSIEDRKSAQELIVSKMSARDRLMGARAVKRIAGKFFEGAFLEEYYKNSGKQTDFLCSVRDGDFVFTKAD